MTFDTEITTFTLNVSMKKMLTDISISISISKKKKKRMLQLSSHHIMADPKVNAERAQDRNRTSTINPSVTVPTP